jgi:hypothetical protein
MIKPSLTRCGVLLLAGIMLSVMLARPHHPAMNHEDQDTELEMNKDVDLGIILDTTSPLRLNIPITNRAKRPITIQNLAKDCSCTSVKIDKLRLAPGETATLTVVTNLSGKTRSYEGNIIVQSDAVERVDQIRVRGRITGQIRIRPARATMLIGDTYAPGAFSVFCDDQDGPWRYAGSVSEDPNLTVVLTRREASPITSVYDGTVELIPGAKDRAAQEKIFSNFQTSRVTLKFVNDMIGRCLNLKYSVDLAFRRKVAIDPPQVTFLGGEGEQRRTITVQSVGELSVDAAQCASSSIRTSLHRISLQAVSVQVVYHPESSAGATPQGLMCELLSGGKTIGSVPINIVEIP